MFDLTARQALNSSPKANISSSQQSQLASSSTAQKIARELEELERDVASDLYRKELRDERLDAKTGGNRKSKRQREREEKKSKYVEKTYIYSRAPPQGDSVSLTYDDGK